ncbi:MAG: hypothetical protein RBT11_13175 [Desulfobacterales bacterium]|jgi:hypothetical protein|nr:hypothetical protein [Desulfobacterales bacterium]
MQIKKFIINALIFFLLNACIMGGLLSFFSGRQRHIRLKNWETESNLLVMGENEHYDVAILGTSRGRIFSRDANHQLMEGILGKKVINLSKGGGGGLMPAELHLSNFYDRGNTVEHIIYLIDPWVFFCAINNENNNFFLRDEPFELSILWKLIARRYPPDRIFSYLQMIAKDDWENFTRYSAPGLSELTLTAINPRKQEEARKHYLSLYEADRFERYSRYLHVINALAKANNSRITYIMLPILMDDFPGAKEVDEKLKAVSREDRVAYYNFVASVRDIRYFYDHMHFNKIGIAHFTQAYLKPILEEKLPLSRHLTSSSSAIGGAGSGHEIFAVMR